MNLCTVTNRKYINNVINLIKSYEINSCGKSAYVYIFDCADEDIEKIKDNTSDTVEIIEIPKVCDHAHYPTGFFYKIYAIKDCLHNFGSLIYSDSTNCFIKKFTDYKAYTDGGRLFLPYTSPKLINQFWSTKKSLKAMNCTAASIMPQYWAGFQVYENTVFNLQFVAEMYEYGLNPDICLSPTTQYPDGRSSPCIEHRMDQTILSALIHKHNIHQRFNSITQQMFGDWQTFRVFDPAYQVNKDLMVLSARESKFGNFRFLS
jgi:hypothetical protein